MELLWCDFTGTYMGYLLWSFEAMIVYLDKSPMLDYYIGFERVAPPRCIPRSLLNRPKFKEQYLPINRRKINTKCGS
jgi:hypothetical protein